MDNQPDANIWRPASPGVEKDIKALINSAPPQLPAAYFDQLRQSDGGEGSLAIEPCWVVFWPADEVVANNLGYELNKWVPGLFGFGSNGGGELLAFDLRVTGQCPIVMVPFIPLELESVVFVAASFDAFRQHIGRSKNVG